MVEFPGSKVNGQIAPALLDLVERNLIRVLDLLVLKKDADGSLEAFELSDMDEGRSESCVRTSRSWRCCLARRMCLPRRRDRAWQLGRAPGVGEEHLGRTVRLCRTSFGGQLVASGRIPIQAMLAAVEADEKEEADEDTEQLAAREGEI